MRQCMQIQTILQAQRNVLKKRISITERLELLSTLKDCIYQHEAQIFEALQKDLNKSPTQSYLTEVMHLYAEIKHAQKILKTLQKPKKIKTPLMLFGGKSKIYYEPYGLVLVISPWNYPFYLSLMPLIGAIAAGNCVSLKPSEYAPNSSLVLKKILSQTFKSELVHVFCGDEHVAKSLLKEKFDYIFFTGSPKVGQMVMQAASKHLTPITLELGGKNPCIMHDASNLKITARRIIWGKFSNAGQTCIAPDLLFVQEEIYEDFLFHLKESIKEQYAPDAQDFNLHQSILDSKDYGKIISQRHFNRALELLEEAKNMGVEIVFGGKSDQKNLQISPTLLALGSLENIKELASLKILKEEIFAPLLPIITYKDIHALLDYIHSLPTPLALYLFSQDEALKERIIEEIPFGGGCINDCMLHIANHNLPFGGRGSSGMGAYHGKFSFETFSHKKAIYQAPTSFDLPLRYPPLVKKFLGLSKLKILKYLKYL